MNLPPSTAGDPVVQLGNTTVTLLAERAIFWPTQDSLIVADLHIGKAASFRAAAIPVPGGTTAETLRRLSQAVERSGARRLIILGDLIHAQSGRSPKALATFYAWRQANAHLEIMLVRGNHDYHAGDPPSEWAVACLDAPVVDPPFVYVHEPQQSPLGYTLAGHLHPAARLNGRGRQSLKLPCFHLGQHGAVLPAFGDFTGSSIVRPAAGDRVHVIAGNDVIDVTPHN